MTNSTDTAANSETRSALESFIATHPLAAEFLGWIDEHEAVVERLALALVIREVFMPMGGPVGGDHLIERLRADYDDVDPSWAPLLARLVLREYPELAHAIDLGPSSPADPASAADAPETAPVDVLIDGADLAGAEPTLDDEAPTPRASTRSRRKSTRTSS